MRALVLTPFLLAPLASAGELLVEERKLGEVPEGVALEGETVYDPDGNPWPVVHRVQWSPDGRRVAHVGLREGRTHAVIDGVVLDAYDFLGAPVWSDDGEHVAFRAGNRESSKRERWYVLLDGERQGAEDWIGALRFAPGSDELCYWTQPGARLGAMGEYTGGDLVFRRGKKKGKKWDDAHALLPIAASADGDVVASPALRKGEWHVMRFDAKGERKIGRREEGHAMITGFALSPDGKDAAIVCPDPRASAPDMPDLPAGMAPPAGMFGPKPVVIHGKEVYGRDEDGAGQPVFSPNGKHLAYKLLDGDAMGVAIDGACPAPAPGAFVHTPVWSPDSKRVAYAVTEGGEVSPFWRLGPEGDSAVKGGRTTVVVHDRRGKGIERGADHAAVRDLAWSPDGDVVAYAARTDEGWAIVCGEARGPAYDEVGPPVFAPDGSAVCYGARSGRELWWRVLRLGD